MSDLLTTDKKGERGANIEQAGENTTPSNGAR